jgi:hypothetical protein
VHPLESPCQQCHLVLSKYIKLLVWQRHQRGQGVHSRGCVSVSTFATDESKTMRVSWALKTGSQPRSNSADLRFENNSFTIRVSYFSDSRIDSTFPSHTVRSNECKNFTALSWSSYGSTSPLALMLFTTTVNYWKRPSADSLGWCVKFSYSLW